MSISPIKTSPVFKSNKEQWVYNKDVQRQLKRILPENNPYETASKSYAQITMDNLANQAKVQLNMAEGKSISLQQANFDKFLRLIDKRAGSNLEHTLDRKLLAQALTDISVASKEGYDNATLAQEGKEVIKNTFSDILDETDSDLEYQPSRKTLYLKRLTSDRQLNLLAKKYALDELVLKNETIKSKDKNREINARAFCAFIGAIAQRNPSFEIQEYFWDIFSDLADEEVYGVACYEDRLNDFIAVYGNDEYYSEFYSKENDKIRATLIYKDKILASNVGKDRDSAYALACESAYRKLKNGVIEISRKPVFEFK